MKNFTVILALGLGLASFAWADDVFRIEVGKDYNRYSTSELQRRVWELERAVWQLQQRVFQLEATKPSTTPAVDSWVCTIEARGDKHSGTGGSKAVASLKALEACKAANDGSAFFCKTPTCEQ